MATRKKSKAAPVQSEKRIKFLEMSEKRVERAVKLIDLVGNLSAYEWQRDEVEKMIGRMIGHCFGAKARFERTRRWKESN